MRSLIVLFTILALLAGISSASAQEDDKPQLPQSADACRFIIRLEYLNMYSVARQAEWQYLTGEMSYLDAHGLVLGAYRDMMTSFSVCVMAVSVAEMVISLVFDQ